MFKKKQSRIFLDNASITPVDKAVEKEMLNTQKKFWGNPSSLHLEGEQAKMVLEDARVRIAKILHCRANEIVFTSGGTESLNVAIFGTINIFEKNFSKIPHVIVSTIEHPAVLEPIKFLLEEKRIEVSFISPNENGIINPKSIEAELKENTALVIVQHANNEIGTIQPIIKIASVIKKFRDGRTDKIMQSENEVKSPLPVRGGGLGVGISSFPYFLVDASQSVLFEDISLERLGADLLVFDGIKMYGPRGAGVLAKRFGVKISPMFFGGGQENSLRPGTENVVAASGLAKALEIAFENREKNSKKISILRDYTIEKILKEIPNSSLNGSLENRLPNNINICFPNNDSEFLVIKLDTLGFAVSAASACHAISLENSSFVIKAIGKPECAASSLRITLGRDSAKSDLDKFISVLKKIVK